MSRKATAKDLAHLIPVQSLFVSDQPRMFQAELAVMIGLNEAILVQQIHYWLARTNNVDRGRKWVWNSAEKWQEQFPWWSVCTVRRIFSRLESRGILLRNRLGQGWDQTLAHTIDYERLNTIRLQCDYQISDSHLVESPKSIGSHCVDPSTQVAKMDVRKVRRCSKGTETNPETTAAEPSDAAAAGATPGKAWTPADPDDEPFALEQSDLFPSPPTRANPTPAPFAMADPTAPPPRPAPMDAGTDIAMSAAHMRGAGVADEVADRLAVQHTLERVRAAIAKAQRKAVKDKATNVPGYIVATLQNGGPIALPDGVRNRDYAGTAERTDHREAMDRDAAKRAAERAAAEAGQQTDRQYLDAYAERNGAAAMDGVASQVKAEILTGRDVAGVKANDFTAKRLMTAAGWSGNRLWESLMVGWLKQQKGG